MRTGYLGIDQWGREYHMNKHPLKELLEETGYSSSNPMYVDLMDGGHRRKGWVLSQRGCDPLWVSVYEVHTMSRWSD